MWLLKHFKLHIWLTFYFYWTALFPKITYVVDLRFVSWANAIFLLLK